MRKNKKEQKYFEEKIQQSMLSKVNAQKKENDSQKDNQFTLKNEENVAFSEKTKVPHSKISTKTQKDRNRNRQKSIDKNSYLDFDKKSEDESDITQIRNIIFSEKNEKEQESSIYDIIFANLIALAGIMLSAFIPILSFALPILFYIYIEVGLYGFIMQKQLDIKTKFENLFVSLKKYVRVFCVFVIKMILIMFWLCIFIVPGVVCFLNYCFTANILFETDNLDAKGVLILSKELVKGYRATIFLYMGIALASLAVAVTAMFLILMLFDVFFVISPTFYIIFLIVAMMLDFILVALPLVETVIVNCYIDAKKNRIQRKQA